MKTIIPFLEPSVQNSIQTRNCCRTNPGLLGGAVMLICTLGCPAWYAAPHSSPAVSSYVANVKCYMQGTSPANTSIMQCQQAALSEQFPKLKYCFELGSAQMSSSAQLLQEHLPKIQDSPKQNCREERAQNITA